MPETQTGNNVKLPLSPNLLTIITLNKEHCVGTHTYLITRTPTLSVRFWTCKAMEILKISWQLAEGRPNVRIFKCTRNTSVHYWFRTIEIYRSKQAAKYILWRIIVRNTTYSFRNFRAYVLFNLNSTGLWGISILIFHDETHEFVQSNILNIPCLGNKNHMYF